VAETTSSALPETELVARSVSARYPVLVRTEALEPTPEHGEPSPAPLGWPHVVIGRDRDRPLARFIVGASGLVLGASTGMFVGGMVGVILAMVLLPLLPHLAFGVLMVMTLMCGSAGAVVGRRVLQRETFDELS
jgi:hypothetical protein